MEYLDIVDEMGNPTGEIVEREYAHRHGIRHRTSHVWSVSYTHLRAHETGRNLVCRLLLEKKKKKR